eukprot:TRINITY_DN8159_c0_g1_i2.p1 TRINITY_DN8159_c0_g1~~TRINITY_DN8159_c0_g1_i2.p1  ORF type:complete len:428 (+),score=66.08 TRINITY_DN8159_c0_g1_i2:96-1379(+)
MIRRPPRSTLSSSSAASDVYKRQAARASPKLQPQRSPKLHSRPSPKPDPRPQLFELKDALYFGDLNHTGLAPGDVRGHVTIVLGEACVQKGSKFCEGRSGAPFCLVNPNYGEEVFEKLKTRISELPSKKRKRLGVEVVCDKTRGSDGVESMDAHELHKVLELANGLKQEASGQRVRGAVEVSEGIAEALRRGVAEFNINPRGGRLEVSLPSAAGRAPPTVWFEKQSAGDAHTAVVEALSWGEVEEVVEVLRRAAKAVKPVQQAKKREESRSSAGGSHGRGSEAKDARDADRRDRKDLSDRKEQSEKRGGLPPSQRQDRERQDRDKGRSGKDSRDRHRDDRDKDRDRDRRSRSRDRDKDRDRGKDRDRDRDRDRDKDRDKDRYGDRDRDRPRDKDRDRDRSDRDRDRDRDRQRDDRNGSSRPVSHRRH